MRRLDARDATSHARERHLTCATRNAFQACDANPTARGRHFTRHAERPRPAPGHIPHIAPAPRRGKLPAGCVESSSRSRRGCRRCCASPCACCGCQSRERSSYGAPGRRASGSCYAGDGQGAVIGRLDVGSRCGLGIGQARRFETADLDPTRVDRTCERCKCGRLQWGCEPGTYRLTMRRLHRAYLSWSGSPTVTPWRFTDLGLAARRRHRAAGRTGRPAACGVRRSLCTRCGYDLPAAARRPGTEGGGRPPGTANPAPPPPPGAVSCRRDASKALHARGGGVGGAVRAAALSICPFSAPFPISGSLHLRRRSFGGHFMFWPSMPAQGAGAISIQFASRFWVAGSWARRQRTCRTIGVLHRSDSARGFRSS